MNSLPSARWICLVVLLMAACSPSSSAASESTYEASTIRLTEVVTGEPTEVAATAPTEAIAVTEEVTKISLDEADTMKIRLTIEDTVLTATLIDSETTRDFISLLPLTLTLEDYAGTEKIAYLSRKLSIEGAPSGSDPSVGDITYYAPWGNLAIFYRDSGYASGLVMLGKLDSGIEALDASGSLQVTIEHIIGF